MKPKQEKSHSASSPSWQHRCWETLLFSPEALDGNAFKHMLQPRQYEIFHEYSKQRWTEIPESYS